MDCLNEFEGVEHSLKWEGFKKDFESFYKRKMQEETERELRMGFLKIPNDSNPRWQRYRKYLISIVNDIKRKI